MTLSSSSTINSWGRGWGFLRTLCIFCKKIYKTFWSLTQYSSDRTNTFFKNIISPNLQLALPSIQTPINRCCGSLPAVKRPGPELDHSLPSNAEVKNEWSCTSTPPIRLHGVDRDNFTFTYISPNGKPSGFICGMSVAGIPNRLSFHSTFPLAKSAFYLKTWHGRFHVLLNSLNTYCHSMI